MFDCRTHENEFQDSKLVTERDALASFIEMQCSGIKASLCPYIYNDFLEEKNNLDNRKNKSLIKML